MLQVTFGKPGAPLTRLDDTKTGFYAVTDDIKTIDKLLTDKAKTELSRINLTAVIPPPAILARRTIATRLYVDEQQTTAATG